MSSRTRCGSCGSTDLEQFLNLGSTPLADAFPAAPDTEETFYPLGLCVCHKCWLVQNTEIVPDHLLYNAEYGFYTGASPSSIAYFKDYATWAIERFGPKFVVEIASNDGTLLAHFTAESDVLGVEPSGNVAAAALAKDIPTHVAPFGRAAAAEIAVWEGKPDLIIANNVVAHVSNLDDFLGGIADLLAPHGHAVIEFQNVADLLLGNQFDHVYHEHRSFFSVPTLDAALLRHGLHIADVLHTPAQGGSYRAVVAHGRTTTLPSTYLGHPRSYAGFQDRVDLLCDRLVDLVAERQREGPVVGYGASAKSTTLLNYSGLDDGFISYVEDLTPYKQGRYTPGTKIPILAPQERRPATYLLLTWNYLSGVLRRERDFLDRGGRFIVPIPAPVLL